MRRAGRSTDSRSPPPRRRGSDDGNGKRTSRTKKKVRARTTEDFTQNGQPIGGPVIAPPLPNGLAAGRSTRQALDAIPAVSASRPAGVGSVLSRIVLEAIEYAKQKLGEVATWPEPARRELAGHLSSIGGNPKSRRPWRT